MTQWDFQNKGKSGWTGKSSFVLEVPLRYLSPSVIYFVPCDRILQRAYWLVNTDGNGATARVVLLDFLKAFDLIDHSVFVQKLTTYDIPSQVKSWIVDFLMDRKQRVQLAQDCHSKWRSVPSGVPQGTKLGPWLFLVMINDLDTPADMWKYVDDTSCSEIVTKGSESKLQEAVDDLSRQASIDGFQLNEAKCKELRIGSSNNHDFEPLVLNGKLLELVTSAKLLGMIISHDLKWNMHTPELSRKCFSRLYILRQLKRSGVAPSELVLFYVTCIRPFLEYASPVFHRSLPNYISEDFLTDPKEGTQNPSIYHEQHSEVPKDLLRRFSVLKTYRHKFDCLVNEMLFIRDLKPTLKVESDSIRPKVFT